MLTLSAAAERLGVAADTLRQQIHAGRLKAEKLGPIWVVTEAALGAYELASRGRVGRPFKGQPGHVDTDHVRVRLLFGPADGRGHDAIWLQYLRENFVLDLDLTNAKPFQWTGEAFQELRADTTPPAGRVIRLWNTQQVARRLAVHVDLLNVLLTQDGTLPRPIVTFHDGPVWDADRVERWLAGHRVSVVGAPGRSTVVDPR